MVTSQLRIEAIMTRLRALQRDTWVALAVFVVAALLRFNHLNVITDNYDEGVYTASLRSLASGHVLYAQIYHAQPPLFLYLLLPWYQLFGQTMLASRTGVVLYSLLGLAAMWWLGRSLGGPRVGLVALVLLSFDPLYLAQSRAVMAEAPALAFAILAVAIAATLRERQDERLAALAGACFLVSMLIKLFTLPAIIPIAIWLLRPTGWPALARTLAHERRLPTWAELRAAWQSSQRTVIAFAAGLAVVVAITLVLIGSNFSSAWSQMVGLHVAATGAFTSQRLQNLGLFLSLGWDYIMIVTGLVAGWLGWRQRRWDVALVAIWGLASAFVLAIQTPLFDHHLTLLAPPFALAAASLMGLLPERIGFTIPEPARQYFLPALVMLAFVANLGQSIALENAQIQHPPAQVALAAVELDQFAPQGGLVVTDDQTIADIANRAIPAPVVDTSYVRISSGKLTTQQVIAAASDPRVVAILWYSGRFDYLPGFHTWVTQHYTRVVAYDGGAHGLYLRLPQTAPVG